MTIEDVTVVITKETAAVTQAGFGMPLIVGDTKNLSGLYAAAGYTVCKNLTEVAAIVPRDVGSGTEGNPEEPGVVATQVYKIAQFLFGQTPAPEKVAVVWFDMGGATGDAAKINAGLNKVLADGHDDWYFLLSPMQDKTSVETLAANAAAAGKIYFVSQTKEQLTALSAGTKANERAVVLCHKTGAATEYPAEAWVGRCAPEYPGSITWKFKTLNGVSVSGYIGSDASDIKSANANLVVSQGGILHTTEGKTLGGPFIDIIRCQDWVKSRIAENVFRLLAVSPKVPYDDRGIAMVLAEVQGVMQQATAQGIIARDADGNGMWSVTAPKRSEIAANNIANRVLPDVKFEFTLAGAIHSVTVRGVISV